MTEQEIEQKVREVLADQLAVPIEDVKPQANFENDLDADSLDLVEAVLGLEEALDIKIPEGEMDGVETVADAVALATKKLSVAG